MTAMLATIDDDTARKVERDRVLYGTGCMMIRADGSAVHVPIARVQILPAPSCAARARGRLPEADRRRVPLPDGEPVSLTWDEVKARSIEHIDGIGACFCWDCDLNYAAVRMPCAKHCISDEERAEWGRRFGAKNLGHSDERDPGARDAAEASVTRIVILGGPKTGKTTLAMDMVRRESAHHLVWGVNARSTDDLIHLGWSEASQYVADQWLTQPGPWIIEGVAAVRALRKWRDQHPGEAPPVDRVIALWNPYVDLSLGQGRMLAQDLKRWWDGVEPWLREHGVGIGYPQTALGADTGWREDPGSDRHRVPHPGRST